MRKSKEAATLQERQEARALYNYMQETEMYVVISKEGDEEDKFAKQGLDIKPHRKAIDTRFGNEKLTLKDRFQKDKDPFRLVFLCSKWLTGFDSPTISTLYLDKPMQNHTLMQTIARANRVSAGKTCGMIIDYFGVFENLEKAFEKYGRKHNKKIKEGANPAQTTEALHKILADAVDAGKEFLQDNECDIDLILNDANTFKKIKLFSTFANNVSKTEELRKEFNVHENAIRNIYDATQPDPEIATQYKRIKEAYEYLRQIINREIEGGDFDAAVEKTRVLMDDSIDTHRDAMSDKISYVINETSEIDLRTLNLDKVEKKFKETELKYLAIVDIKDFLAAQLERMLNANTTRIDFAQRLQEIIDKYNSKSSDVNEFFAALKDYMAKLRTEDLRAQSEGLTEAELQIFDLLYKDKLTKAEKQQVKLASKSLLEKLQAERDKILVVDWHKNQRQRINVERYIMKQLYPQLKEVYDTDTFREQAGKVFNFMMEQAEGRGGAYA